MDQIKHYSLNLAHRPFVNTTVPMLLAAMAAAGIVLFTVFNALVLLDTGAGAGNADEQLEAQRQRMDEVRNEIDTIDQKLAALEIGNLETEVRYVNSLITRRAMSWSRLFDRMELLVPPDMRIQRISPSIRGTNIVLTLSLVVPEQIVLRSFITALEESPHFGDVELESEQPGRNDTGIHWVLNVAYFDEP